MTRLFLVDFASLVLISAVISVVYCLAKNHPLQRSPGTEILRTFFVLVLGITGCALALLALSPLF